jgi:predicted transcriptional regulator
VIRIKGGRGNIGISDKMTLYPLEEIKIMRKRHSLNQTELAKKAGVSQSLIAKIEAGKVDPTYTNAKKIFEALEELQVKEETKAEEIMNKRVSLVDVNELVGEVIRVMKYREISQVPIVSRGKVVGIITESTILERMMNEPEKTKHYRAGDIMEEAPPIISRKTGLKTVAELLKSNAILLVAEKGEISGVITKADLLGQVK